MSKTTGHLPSYVSNAKFSPKQKENLAFVSGERKQKERKIEIAKNSVKLTWKRKTPSARAWFISSRIREEFRACARTNGSRDAPDREFSPWRKRFRTIAKRPIVKEPLGDVAETCAHRRVPIGRVRVSATREFRATLELWSSRHSRATLIYRCVWQRFEMFRCVGGPKNLPRRGIERFHFSSFERFALGVIK